MDVHTGYWQRLQGQPGTAARGSCRVVQFCVGFMRLAQATLATQVAVSTGWAMADATAALVNCAGGCVMASDLNVNASNLLAGFLALYALAFITAVVVVGFSLYNLIKPLLRACPPVTATVTCGSNTDFDRVNCTCRAGHWAEWDLLTAALCVAVLELVRNGAVRGIVPGKPLLECSLFVTCLTVLNITALHASHRVERLMMPLVVAQLESLSRKEQQFVITSEV